jgi:YbbR domain-containing protein
MNKWLQNQLVLRVFSLALAFMLWLSVHDTSIILPGDATYTTRIHNVPVETKYDESRFALVRMDDHVELELYGDRFALEHFPLSYHLIVDLTHLGPGKHKVPVEVEGLPIGVNGKVSPATVEVELKEKLHKEMRVQVSFTGRKPEGIGEPVVVPDKVLVKGTEEILDQVKTVRALVSLQNPKQTVEQTVRLQAIGERGVIRDVELYPEIVTVQVPVHPSTKEGKPPR